MCQIDKKYKVDQFFLWNLPILNSFFFFLIKFQMQFPITLILLSSWNCVANLKFRWAIDWSLNYIGFMSANNSICKGFMSILWRFSSLLCTFVARAGRLSRLIWADQVEITCKSCDLTKSCVSHVTSPNVRIKTVNLHLFKKIVWNTFKHAKVMILNM